MLNQDGATGVLLGLACGDALGRPVEFDSADRIADKHETLDEMVGHGTWNKPAGTVTDDTDQVLCIARSVVECDGFDPTDVASKFVDWYQSGPFDIGNMTRRALQRLERGESWDEAGQQVWESSSEGANAGNGSVMRCPPLAIAYADDADRLAEVSHDSSRITHADPRCTHGCAVLNLTIAGFLRGEDRPLSTALERVRSSAPDELLNALEPVAGGETPTSLATTGYVVDTLQTALHDAITAASAEEAIVTVVNRGGDTDTVGAVAGAVAGARFGASSLPGRWLAEIDETNGLRQLAADLQELAGE